MSRVEFSIRDNVGYLRLNRPEKLNALSIDMHSAILDTLRSLANDSSVRALVLTGTGRAFCAGDDMKESDPRDGTLPPEEETKISWHNMIRDMRNLPIPVIGAINGLACGAGGGLTLGCDIRIAAQSASFADVFTKRGIAGGAYLLTQAVGPSKALEIILSGDFLESEECLRIGIFNKVVPDDELYDFVHTYATRIAKGPREAYALSKYTVYQCANLNLNEGLRAEEFSKLICLRGGEVREGISSFNDKRGASF